MIDLLAFGPHPDDIEIGLGGIVAKHAALGLSVGLCDLTAGEMASNGTSPQRLAEAERARVVLGATWRENLRWADRRIGRDAGHLDEAIAYIRRHQPRTVAIPYWGDRHPDHAAASELLREAVFTAALRRYEPLRRAWKVDWICYYFINDDAEPSFVVDVSAEYERKRAALDCHASQFEAKPDAVGTRLNSPVFRQLIESRDARFGARAGVQWAEGIIVREPILRSTIVR